MDWQKLVTKLLEGGLTQPQIAERAQCAQSTLSGIATGRTRDPRASIGLALLQLAHERGIAVPLAWTPDGGVVSGRRNYTPEAVAAGCPPDAVVGRRKNGPGRRATDRVLLEQGGGGAQGAGEGV